MQEYRPKGLIYVFTSNQLLGCFDAVAPEAQQRKHIKI